MEDRHSLLAGRNLVPLTRDDIRRASNVFLGMDGSVNARYEESTQTAFRVSQDESGAEFGEIIFGPDIYPGIGVVDPNSTLSLDAAAAHELAHYYRWRDKRELPHDVLTHLDEAQTSLEAALRYQSHLNSTDVNQLISDAIQRVQLYIKELPVTP